MNAIDMFEKITAHIPNGYDSTKPVIQGKRTRLRDDAAFDVEAWLADDPLTWKEYLMVKQVTNTKTKPRFGDARDAYLKAVANGDGTARNPCTSKGLSTMPRRQRNKH